MESDPNSEIDRQTEEETRPNASGPVLPSLARIRKIRVKGGTCPTFGSFACPRYPSAQPAQDGRRRVIKACL